MRVFKLGLPAMNRTYASIYGTAAIQLKDIPPRPTKYDGCVTLFNVPSADEASVSDDLSRFGEVVDVTLKAGQASVRFASHEQAERCVVGLREEQRAVGFVYNETHYSRERGEPYSGWCTAEQGSASIVAAHLGQVERQARERSAPLPERYVRAQARLRKLIDISDGRARSVEVSEEPAKLLEQTFTAIEHATFVGKGDQRFVQGLLADFEWVVKTTMKQEAAHAERFGTRLAQAASHVKARLSRLSISGGERPSTALVVPAPAAGPSVRAWGLGAWGVRLPRRRRASRLLVGVGGRRSLPPEHGAERAIDEL